MKEVLYINATVGNNSRTDILARYLLSKIDGHMTEIKLESEEITPLDSNSLSERESILNSLNYDNEKLTYAKQFANSDIRLHNSTVAISSFFSTIEIANLVTSPLLSVIASSFDASLRRFFSRILSITKHLPILIIVG